MWKETKVRRRTLCNRKIRNCLYPNDAGKYDEVIKKYYPSGKIQREERYKNNVKEGVYKEYYESGTLMVEGNYKDGKRDGIAKLYNKSGKLIVESDYKDDKRDGIYKRYNENGKLIVEGNYKNGEAVSETCYDEQGNKKHCP